jgi:hypothetical protein
VVLADGEPDGGVSVGGAVLAGPELVGALGDVAVDPPRRVTTAPPGENLTVLVHGPVGAASVTLAMIATDRPAASVPEFWLKLIQRSRAEALQAIGTPPELRNRIMTLRGSAARWFTLTWKSAGFTPPGPRGLLDGLATVPLTPTAGAEPEPAEVEERVLSGVPGAAGVLTETLSPPVRPPVLIGSCGGAASRICGEWFSDTSPSSAADAAAAAPTVPSATADSMAWRTGRDL